MDIKEIVSKMTLEEKAGLCSGKAFWFTKPVERLGVPSVMLSDGPSGIRKNAEDAPEGNFNQSVKGVAFPTGSAMASSFDKELMNTLGKALATACLAENVAVLLGPAVNAKRSPLCGRNFEYLSEDPYLTGEMATDYIKGVQSLNIGTSIKHYLGNNQEYRRMSTSAQIDERTLREIYLASFEKPIREGKPWTVMCAYNKINGEYLSENKKFLNDVLRDEWGYEGFVLTDWGAINDVVKAIKSGLDLEMPSVNPKTQNRIIKAVESGDLDEALVDQAVSRILKVVKKAIKNKKVDWDFDKQHELAKKISSECMVLLKNDGVLPLDKKDKILFVGEFAKKPRFQGGGSSHVNTKKVTDALSFADKFANIEFALGYESKKDEINEVLIKEACDKAKNVDAVVVFAGLPDSYESEGYDRKHMRMPKCQNELIKRVSKENKNVIVVLHNGSPVEMPWVNDVSAVLEVYLGGEAVGAATVEVIFGDVNPSGKLAESFPIKMEHNPSSIYFPGEKDIVEYREGVFIGYRYYDKKKMDVLFPFGHGLSYTEFEYSNLRLSDSDIKDTDELVVEVDVKNIGKISGKEVVQLYVSPQESSVIRPIRELKGFEKVLLEAGEKKTVKFKLNKRSFAYFNININDWYVESGKYNIEIAKSSRNICLVETVNITSPKIKPYYTTQSTFGDVFKEGKEKDLPASFIEEARVMLEGGNDTPEGREAVSEEMVKAMFNYVPLKAIFSFTETDLTYEDLDEMVKKLNE